MSFAFIKDAPVYPTLKDIGEEALQMIPCHIENSNRGCCWVRGGGCLFLSERDSSFYLSIPSRGSQQVGSQQAGPALGLNHIDQPVLVLWKLHQVVVVIHVIDICIVPLWPDVTARIDAVIIGQSVLIHVVLRGELDSRSFLGILCCQLPGTRMIRLPGCREDWRSMRALCTHPFIPELQAAAGLFTTRCTSAWHVLSKVAVHTVSALVSVCWLLCSEVWQSAQSTMYTWCYFCLIRLCSW